MMESFHDTHFHLDLMSNRTNAIEEITKNKIYTIAMTNVPKLYEKEKALEPNPYIRYALGFHPQLVKQYNSQKSLMWKNLSSAKYIGEVGLDYTTYEDRAEQVDFFKELIDRCREDGTKIISIHSRNATSDVIKIIGNKFEFKPILHWFTGSVKELSEAISYGYYFSINLSMTRTKKAVLLERIPKDKLLLETDMPFTNNRLSHKQMLEETIIKISEIIGETVMDTNNLLWANFTRLLNATKIK